MAEPLDELEIKISSSSTDAVKKVNNLVDALDRLKKAASLEGVENTAEKIKAIGKGGMKLSVEVEKSSFTALDRVLEKVNAIKSAIEQVNNTSIKVSTSKKGTGKKSDDTQLDGDQGKDVPSTSVDKVAQRVGVLQRAFAYVKSTVTAFKTETLLATKEGTAALNSMKKELFTHATLWGRIKDTAKGALDSIKTHVSAAAVNSKLLNGMLQVAVPVLGTVGAGFKKLGAGLKSIGKGVLNYITNPFKNALKAVNKWKAAIGRVAFYRLVRTAIKMVTEGFKEGIDNLYYFSSLVGTQFAPAMDSLAASGLYLKNSLGAMAAPLIQAVAPAVETLVKLFVDLLNVVNATFAAMTGQNSYTKALYSAASWGDDLSDAMGGAVESAKEFKRYLIGIDELNVMPEQSEPGGGGGGGSGLDTGDSNFEIADVPSDLTDLAKKIKDAIAAGDWPGAGKILAEKLNGIIDNLDTSSWGQSLGNKLTHAIQASYGFLSTFSFTDLAAKIAEFVNGAFGSLDFTTAGQLFTRKLAIVPDLLIGFFSTLDFGLVAQSVSNFLIGAFNEASTWLGGYDWGALGSTIWQKLKDTVTGIDFAGIASSLFTFLGTAIRSAAQGLAGFFGSIAGDIKTWWNNDIKGATWTETASNLLSAIGQGFANIGSWVWTNIIDPLGKSLLGANTWDSVKEAGANLLSSIGKGITNVGGWVKDHIIDPIKTFLSTSKDAAVEFAVGVKNSAAEWWNNVKTWWAGKVDKVKEFTTGVVNNAKDWWSNVKTWWSGKVGSVKEFATSVANGAATWWSNVKTWWSGKVGSVKEFATSVANGAATWWSNVKTWWSGKVGAVKSFTTAVANGAKTWWSNVKTWWSGKVGAVKSFTTAVANGASTWWSNVKSWWSGKVGSVQSFKTAVVNGASTWWSNVKTWWGEKVGSVKEFATSVANGATTWWSNVQTWWKGKVGSVQSFKTAVTNSASTWWNNVKTWWKGKVGSVQSFKTAVTNSASTWWSNVKKWWSGKVGAVKSFTTSVTNGAKNWWSYVKIWWNQKVGAVKSFTTSVVNSAATWWSSVKTWWKNKSKDGVTFTAKVTSFVDAIKDKTITFKAKVSEVIGNAKAKFLQWLGLATGGIYKNGKWQPIEGYASGGSPRSARLFYANENGMPELVGRIGSSTAVMNNGQIVASVASGVYRAVASAMGGLGGYFASISNGISRIPAALSSIEPAEISPVRVWESEPSYAQVDVTSRNDPRYGGADGMEASIRESNEDMINALYAVCQRVVTAINEKDTTITLDRQEVGRSVTREQNRMTTMYGKRMVEA